MARNGLPGYLVRFLPASSRGCALWLFVMKNSPISPVDGNTRAARSLFRRAFSTLLAGFISVSLPVAISRAQPSSYEAEGEEVLTRGPVHEAFAAVVSYNPAPGIVVKTRPPELIEELPPEEKPEGDDVAWIPGYWGWDDERNDFIWISGTWRILPPGREWLAGYWRENGDGYQWISGYWADADAAETTYLPPPPASLEVGANTDAPSDDYGWAPGCWVWQQDRYAWRAGYWAQGRADWVWAPSYYVWTPRGVIFVDGFWDYPVERRGILFAPVYYHSRGYARRGYSYSPRIAINLTLFQDNLFLRPSYHHYYFGDYYGSRYEQSGFFASISFQSSRQGFEPFYAHDRWDHRSDRGWERRFQASYQDRRDHEAARPPRTWAAQLRVNLSPPAAGQVRVQLAMPLAQLAGNRDNPVRFQAVARDDRQKLAQRGREVQASRDQRRTVEAKPAVTGGRSAGVAAEPVRVAAPRSPIVAQPSGQRGRNPAPPQAPQAPRPETQAQPRQENPGRPQNPDRRNAPAETRLPDPRANAAAVQAPDESQRKEQENAVKARSEDEQHTREQNGRAQAAARSQQAAGERAQGEAAAAARENTARQAQQDSDRRNRDAADRTRQQAEASAKESATRARDDLQRKNQDSNRKAQEAQRQEQKDADQRNRDAQVKSPAAENSREQAAEQAKEPARKARDESRQKTDEPAARAPQPPEREKPAEAKARDDAPRKESPAPARAQPNDERRDRDGAARARPAPKEKPADDGDDDAKQDKDKPRR